MAILVTGGTGYIGSHTVVELLNKGEEVIVVDNFSNSSPDVIDKIKEITGRDFLFYELDILDKEKLEKVFQKHTVEAVIHFAGYKAVGESVEKPLMYYHNNVIGTIHVLETMQKYNCSNFVFSSSATVYGIPDGLPVKEKADLKALNPYGRTKQVVEMILQDVAVSNPQLNIAILRYFNPIGAHESGLIGEKPNGIPNNLMPYIMKVAAGDLEKLNVFGDDYETKDGTGVRDYIHVVDLAKGHIKALEKLRTNPGCCVYNLGTGIGYSVLDIVKTFEKVNKITIPYQIIGRRPGDIAEYYANPEKAKKELDWETTRTLEDMCRDSWHFIQKNKI